MCVCGVRACVRVYMRACVCVINLIRILVVVVREKKRRDVRHDLTDRAQQQQQQHILNIDPYNR